MSTTITKLYDALVVGGGPAGLAAGLALGRVCRTAMVFDSAIYRNESAAVMHTVLSRDGWEPSEFRRIAKNQIIDKYKTIEFVNTELVMAEKAQVTDDYEGFKVRNERGQTWQGRKLILATGSKDILPPMEGYAQNWGHNMYVLIPVLVQIQQDADSTRPSYQCLFCDGFERSNRPIGILTFPDAVYLHFALQAFSFSPPSVTIFTNGPPAVTEAVQEALAMAKARGCVIDERQIRRLVPHKAGVTLQFEHGNDAEVAFLAHKPPTVPGSLRLVEQLGLNVNTIPSVGDVVERNEPFGESNVKGCFACGDASTMLKQVTNAMNSGSASGAGIHIQLCHEEGQRALAQVQA